MLVAQCSLQAHLEKKNIDLHNNQNNLAQVSERNKVSTHWRLDILTQACIRKLEHATDSKDVHNNNVVGQAELKTADRCRRSSCRIGTIQTNYTIVFLYICTLQNIPAP